MVRQGERTSTRQTFTAQRRGRASVLRKFVTASLWVVGLVRSGRSRPRQMVVCQTLDLEVGSGLPHAPLQSSEPDERAPFNSARLSALTDRRRSQLAVGTMTVRSPGTSGKVHADSTSRS